MNFYDANFEPRATNVILSNDKIMNQIVNAFTAAKTKADGNDSKDKDIPTTTDGMSGHSDTNN